MSLSLILGSARCLHLCKFTSIARSGVSMRQQAHTLMFLSPNHRALQIGGPFKSALPFLAPGVSGSPSSWVPECLGPRLPH